MELDLDYDPKKHFPEAAEIRKKLKSYWDQEPVFTSARQSLDACESELRLQPLTSVVDLNRAAFNKLKDNLSNLRSSGTASFFNETVPTADGEACIRGLLSQDDTEASTSFSAANVAESNAASGSATAAAAAASGGGDNNSNRDKEASTAVEINVRPHNASSYAAEASALLEKSKTKIQFVREEGEEGGKKQQAGLVAVHKLKVKKGTTKEDLERGLETMRSFTGNVDAQFDEQEGMIVITMVEYNLTAERDPIRRLISMLAQKLARRQKGLQGISQIEAPDLFRLATVKMEFPMKLSQWLKHEPRMSAHKFLEGMRVAFEVITRVGGAVVKKAEADLAVEVLCERGPRHAKAVVSALGGLTTFKELSLNIRTAPLELLLALGVKDSSEVSRQVLQKELQRILEEGEVEPVVPVSEEEGTYEDSEQSGYNANKKQNAQDIKECLTKTTLEEATATMISDRLKFGMTNDLLIRSVRQLIASAIVGAYQNGGSSTKQILLAVNNILSLVGHIESNHSLTSVTHSGCVEIKYTGIDCGIWDTIIPHPSCQGIVDDFKSFAVALNKEFSDAELKGEKEEEEKKSEGEEEERTEEQIAKKQMTTESLIPSPDYPEVFKDQVTAIFADMKPILNMFSSQCGAFAGLFQRVQKRTSTSAHAEPSSAFDFYYGSIGDEAPEAGQPHRLCCVCPACMGNQAGEPHRLCCICSECMAAATARQQQGGGEQQQQQEEGQINMVPLLAPVAQVAPQVPLQVPQEQEETSSSSSSSGLAGCGDDDQEISAAVAVPAQEAEGRKPIRLTGTPPSTPDKFVEISGGPSGKPVHAHQEQEQEEQNNNNNNNSKKMLLTPSPPRQTLAEYSSIQRPRPGVKKDMLYRRLGHTYDIPTSKEKLRLLFDSYDLNGDQKLDLREFIPEYIEFQKNFGLNLTKQQAVSKFFEFDLNHDDHLSFDEFRVGMLRVARQ